MRVVRRGNMRVGRFEREIGRANANTPEVAGRAEIGDSALAYKAGEVVFGVAGAGGGFGKAKDLSTVPVECGLDLLDRELDGAGGGFVAEGVALP